MAVEGPVNTDVFGDFVEQVLVPGPRADDIVVMDNLCIYKWARNWCSCRPTPPDLSPIEPAFSKIEQKLGSLARRTRQALWSSLKTVLDTVTGSDATNYFAHCGFRPA